MPNLEIQTVNIKDKKYPAFLKQISDPPANLYFKGELPSENEICLAVVGTRRYSDYGKRAAIFLSEAIARAGLTIVSGLAIGIDTFAHESALEMRGRTIAVLGSGLDEASIYPAQNRKLADKIVENGGCIVSEYQAGTKALLHHFPLRNRIISGLSRGVLVVEARGKSGALITASRAIEQNREVFALPGSIFSQTSFGPNNLIKLGARLVTGVNDILEEFNLPIIETKQRINPETKEEEDILTFLFDRASTIDDIIKETKLDIATVSSTLTLLEIKGAVKNIGGTYMIL